MGFLPRNLGCISSLLLGLTKLPGPFGEDMGACGLVGKVLDSRSEGLGFDSQCWSCVEASGKLILHSASVHPAVMGIWCIDPRLDQ